MNWRDISEKYPVFRYKSYHHEQVKSDLMITFDFAIDGLAEFHPSVTIKNIPQNQLEGSSKEFLDNLVFHLGLIESLSYWKATAAKTIDVECGSISDEQKPFWQTLLLHGMGEYIYKNQIDVEYIKSVEFRSMGEGSLPVYGGDLSHKAVIPVGGGKDSAVTAALSHDWQWDSAALVLNPTPASNRIIATNGFKDVIIVERVIDPGLLNLNKQGFLNGHTPFSAYLAFLSVLTAVFFDYQDIVLSNERSANQGNVEYQGITINHQYSKTFEFEKAFHEYAKKYLATNINYFSLLRPLYELEIAKLFATKCQDVLTDFRSCNVNQKKDSWCEKCPKCLFTYIMLYPFLDTDQMRKVFSHDLFGDESLLPVFKELLGMTEVKPFECVGTYEEIRAALYLATKKTEATTPLLSYFATEVLPNYPDIARDTQSILNSWNNENLLPDHYSTQLKQTYEAIRK